MPCNKSSVFKCSCLTICSIKAVDLARIVSGHHPSRKISVPTDPQLAVNFYFTRFQTLHSIFPKWEGAVKKIVHVSEENISEDEGEGVFRKRSVCDECRWSFVCKHISISCMCKFSHNHVEGLLCFAWMKLITESHLQNYSAWIKIFSSCTWKLERSVG